ncbi:hypothetical protein GGS23DRAFT_393315 [Durotheca rogersii]|uniref:uncharacterized protein n=1 Tax=Durotheca rogersii TaxID=419775 RepID=UPI002221056B|nr:uncharacterized protein GGS23DRAFT_393315 [Durotheca rogersii]KAI5856782.1 hypothetical protein GGS23DRAFT_393315 [Durotheca rogersii]
MSAVASRAPLGGRRPPPPTSLPRATSSRIFSLCLRRRSPAIPCVCYSLFSRGLTTTTTTTTTMTTTTAIATTAPLAGAAFSPELHFLRELLYKSQANDKARPARPALRQQAVEAAEAKLAHRYAEITENLPYLFLKALEAMRRGDSRRLLTCLERITRMGTADLQHAVVTLPRTTFTEFLRSLDPFRIASEADPTDRVYISPGAFHSLNMKSTLDEWGVRRVYVRLVRRMLVLMMALKASGQILHTDEYTYLLRCAGAASDPMGAKWIWREMDRTETTDWRHSDVYAEFVAARFLTRPLYSGYDKMRRIVTPRNLRGSRIHLAYSRYRKLERLRFNTRPSRLRFGLNKDARHVEELMRMMRKRGPVMRLFRHILEEGNRMNESLLCALMIGFGRVGSLWFVSTRILQDYFGIRVTQWSSGTRKGGVDVAPEKGAYSPVNRVTFRMRPTARTMAAVVETFGSNGEIVTAFQVVDHISREHQIPIPRAVWQDLLEWAHIMGSLPMSTAWKYAGMRSKIPHPDMVEALFTAMTTSSPANPHGALRPGFDQYSVLIRNLLGKRRFRRALPYMRLAVEIYHDQHRAFEDAALEQLAQLRDRIGSPASSAATIRHQRARFLKGRMWYDINNWCRQILAKTRSFAASPPDTFLPDVVREFALFMPNPIRYRTASGYVELFDPARPRIRARPNNNVAYLNMVMRERATLRERPVRLPRVTVKSSHSLDIRAFSKLNPFTVLTGETALLVSESNIITDSLATRPPSDASANGGERGAVDYDDEDDYS